MSKSMLVSLTGEVIESVSGSTLGARSLLPQAKKHIVAGETLTLFWVTWWKS